MGIHTGHECDIRLRGIDPADGGCQRGIVGSDDGAHSRDGRGQRVDAVGDIGLVGLESSESWLTQQATRALLEPRAVTCAVMGVMSELLRVLMDMEVKACDVDTALVTAAF